MNAIPIKQLTKRRTIIIFVITVIIVYCLQTDHQCSFPNKVTSINAIHYVANVTRVDLATSEKTVFTNLTDKVRRLIDEANQELEHIALWKQLVGPSALLGRNGQKGAYALTEMDRLWQSRFSVEFGSHVYLPGGHWRPNTCKPRWKVAIVIPFRDRFDHLHTLLRNLVPFLLNQELEFGIFVAEQGFSEMMNRGLMRNIGYQLARHTGTDWDCYIFHDVDYIPMNTTNYYGCDGYPKHYAVNLEEHNYGNPHPGFGGVVGLTRKQMERLNGYSNVYWGWGGEDDDMVRRIQAKRYRILRSQEGFYRALSHRKKSESEIVPDRFFLVNEARKRMDKDGLSAMRYPLEANISLSALYTKISVDMRKEDWNFGNWKVSPSIPR